MVSCAGCRPRRPFPERTEARRETNPMVSCAGCRQDGRSPNEPKLACRRSIVRGAFSLPGVTSCLLGALLWGHAPRLAGQDVASKDGTPGVASAPPAAAPVDPRFRSPRATVRTFLIAMNLTEDDPHKIEEAVACLDLSEIPAGASAGGRLAYRTRVYPPVDEHPDAR